MKLIISWDPENSGKSLGILVGMLTLGTALPHGIRSVGQVLSWQTVILVSSCLALIATTIVWRLGEGPHLNKSSRKTSWKLDSIFQAFKLLRFRASALGYFGHMWELYAFWTLVPMLLALCFKEKGYSQSLNISLWAFGIIGVGAIGCIVGGMLSQKIGSAKVAWYALMTSGMMCLLYPFFDEIDVSLKLAILFIWGISVVADSPQFSAMSAKACPQDLIGTALTIQNSIGFGLTILSILFVTAEIDQLGSKVVWILLPGPILGLFFMRSLPREINE
jgi:predicted MFS family arabinose efflux permease